MLLRTWRRLASTPQRGGLVMVPGILNEPLAADLAHGAGSRGAARASPACYRVATSDARSGFAGAVNVPSISAMVRPLVSKPMNQIAAAPTRYQKPK
jgi:hypothetical protein